ncbi:MAG: arginine--tRNA ligase [bacterium]
MNSIPTLLAERLAAAVEAAFPGASFDRAALVEAAQDTRFGDYQCNAALKLAKSVGRPPRDVANAIVGQLRIDDLCEPPSIAGPGFVNLTVHASLIARTAMALRAEPTLGVAPTDAPHTVVVDYSAPNIAKEMHVGHLRSTIIGDSLVRVLEFLGHRVIRQNHVGDWGTQFGMLIEHLIDSGAADAAELGVKDLDAFYQAAKRQFDASDDFKQRARARVVSLQGGDERSLALWRRLVEESERHFRAVYAYLGVRLTDGDIRPESFFNPRLAEVVGDLQALGLARESEGATCVFPDGFRRKDGEPLPMIVRKADGGYLYATTDLAALRFRVSELRADRIAYVVGEPQAQHFAMLFAVARTAGWLPSHVRAEHVGFGSVLGPDRKPFKTRAGGTVKLVDLLTEAVERGRAALVERPGGRDLSDIGEAEKLAIAQTLGIGAVKYADLSTDRTKDYVFDWDRMLALNGNTAPYLINAYVRIRSILRKAVSVPSAETPIVLGAPAERDLALALTRFPEVVNAVAEKLLPHVLCTYLYELASRYHKFYETCPVLAADDPDTRASRLALCDVVARVLRQGLELLGIGTVEQM